MLNPWILLRKLVLVSAVVCGPGISHDLNAQDAATQQPSTIQAIGEVETVHEGFDFTEGPAWDPKGNALYFTDIPNAAIHKLSSDDKLSNYTEASKHTNGLLVVADGRMLGCQMDGQVVAYDTKTGESKVLADSFEGKRFNAPNDLVIDTVGGIYFTDPLFRAPDPLPQGIQCVYYIHPKGEVSRVTDHIAAPNGIALSPDGKSLYVAPSHQSEMLVYDVKGPGKLSNGRTLCTVKQPEGKTGTGGDGMVVDVKGNLYFTTHLGVEIVSPEGVHLGLVTFPEQPANVTFGGSDRKTMYVTARHGVYRVKMPIAGLPPN